MHRIRISNAELGQGSLSTDRKYHLSQSLLLLPYYYDNHFTALWILSVTPRWRHQKGKTKTNLDFLEQETVSGNGINWAIRKCASHYRQPCQHPTTQFLQDGWPSCHPTNSVKAMKATDVVPFTFTF